MLPFNFNHLYYFYEVARKGSFSHAAETLRVSQSAISVQIKQFETSLGHTLFNRIKTGVELTESGNIVFEYAEEIFSDVDRVRNALAAMEHDLTGTISIGTVNSIGIYFLPEVLKDFNQEYPQVKVGILFKSPPELIAAVRGGRTDFAILTANRRYPGLTSVPIQKNKMFLVAPPDHPLAGLEEIALADLEKYPFLGFEEGMETRAMMDALFRRMSLSIEYVVESSNVATIKHMAMAGLGLAILPETAVGPEIRQGTLVRPSVPSLYMVQEITAYHKTSRPLTPTRQRFLAGMQGHITGERTPKR
ncbi:MAG: LysR family transcriptional regulator [Candidatus Krumholzibacteriia bacterium]